MAGDLIWIIKSVRSLQICTLSFPFYLLALRFSWALYPVLYQFFALFLESVTKRQNEKLESREMFFICITSMFSMFFVYVAIMHFNCALDKDRSVLENVMQQVTMLYTSLPLMLSSIGIVIFKMNKNIVPRILKKQLIFFLSCVIAPMWVFDFLQAIPISSPLTWVSNSYTFLTFSNMFLIGAIYYSSSKMMRLRFLNITKHVYEIPRFDFIQEFKEILERLSNTNKEVEMNKLVQEFFHTGLEVDPHHVYFSLRPVAEDNQYPTYDCDEEVIEFRGVQEKYHGTPQAQIDRLMEGVERFFKSYPKIVTDSTDNLPIFIHDEVAFDNFYEETLDGTMMLTFLEQVSLDIFLPIYHKGRLVAYITVDRNARVGGKKLFYTDVERAQMLVFSNYLTNIINLLQNKNIDLAMQREHQLRQTLHQKVEELNHYRESLRVYAQTKQLSSQIGVIFYKHRSFTFGNLIAQDLLKINPNVSRGHPFSQELRQLVNQVLESRAMHSKIVDDGKDRFLVFQASPHSEGNMVIITVSLPSIADIVSKHTLLLNDSVDWDYFLYLETTRHGQLMHEAIPGSTEPVIKFKIKLLQIALSKKPTLLVDIPPEDIMPFVELLHSISLKEKLHSIKIQSALSGPDLSLKLFGVSKLSSCVSSTPSIVEKLHNKGTLFIHNVHYLPYETQEMLLECIKFGFYRNIHTDQRINADIRLICTVDQPLDQIIHRMPESAKLLGEFTSTTILLPHVSQFAATDLVDMATSFGRSISRDNPLSNLLSLTNHEKNSFQLRPPDSITELKNRVLMLLESKQKQHKKLLQDSKDSDTDDIQLTEQALSEIAVLGRRALQDRASMATLWKIFKNQNAIADFLKVNRSSVNRRCKEFNL